MIIAMGIKPFFKKSRSIILKNGILYHLSFIFIFIFVFGCSTPTHYVRKDIDVSNIRKIAVLPLENFTSNSNSDDKIRRTVIIELMSRDVEVVEPGEITSTMRKLRIRSINTITTPQIKKLGGSLGVQAVMKGSVSAFRISKGISVSYPEISVHLLLVDTSSGNTIWSVLHSAGGASFWTRHFGAEGKTLEETSRKVVKQALDTLF